MDLEPTFNDVLSHSQRAETASTGWASLIQYLEERGGESLRQLSDYCELDVFSCWTQFSSQPCRDIFVDPQGQHWICKACGTTGKPGPGKCNPISQATLNNGL